MQNNMRPGWKRCREAIDRIPAQRLRIGVISFCALIWILLYIALF